MAIFDTQGDRWRLTLARWPPDRLARHRAVAAALVRSGWKEDTADLVAMRRIEDEEPTDERR